MASTAVASARAIHCSLRRPSKQPPQLPVASLRPEREKIMLQPRLCTLRSYGSADHLVKKAGEGEEAEGSPFFEALSEYIEFAKKSQDFEILSGRLAMIIFAATVVEESVTGNSVFRKMDLLGIEEAGGACLVAVTFAAVFAWFSSARNRVGHMFAVGRNTFIDSLIDHIVDGLFYENERLD